MLDSSTAVVLCSASAPICARIGIRRCRRGSAIVVVNPRLRQGVRSTGTSEDEARCSTTCSSPAARGLAGDARGPPSWMQLARWPSRCLSLIRRHQRPARPNQTLGPLSMRVLGLSLQS